MSSKDNADYLMQIAMNHGIKDPKELANFMGQMQVESGGYASMNESLNYSGKRLLEVFPGRNGLHTTEQANAIAAGGPEAVANAIYGGDWGKAPEHLGNTEPGDGWKYHGRGYVQLTGRANYERIGREMGLDFVNHPELAENREIAANIAVHYWESRVVPHNHQKDVAGACHDINGGEKGLREREEATASWNAKLAHDYVPSVTTEASQVVPIPGANTHATGGTHGVHGTSAVGALKEGTHGAAVHTLQADLAKLGYIGTDGKPLKSDSDFGTSTRRAVETFQHDHHLKVDGIAGPRTLEAIHYPQAYATPGLADPKHPDHTMYEQALAGVHRLDANLGRTPDRYSDNLAASLVVAAKREGMTKIDSIALNEDGSRVFAVQDTQGWPLRQFAHVQTADALNTPVAQSAAAAARIKPPESVSTSHVYAQPQADATISM